MLLKGCETCSFHDCSTFYKKHACWKCLVIIYIYVEQSMVITLVWVWMLHHCFPFFFFLLIMLTLLKMYLLSAEYFRTSYIISKEYSYLKQLHIWVKWLKGIGHYQVSVSPLVLLSYVIWPNRTGRFSVQLIIPPTSHLFLLFLF